MIALFEILLTAVLFWLVTLLVDQTLKSNMRRSNYLIGVAVFCCVMLAAFLWNVGIFWQ